MEAQEIFIVFYQQLLARTVDMPLGVGRVVWSFKKKGVGRVIYCLDGKKCKINSIELNGKWKLDDKKTQFLFLLRTGCTK